MGLRKATTETLPTGTTDFRAVSDAMANNDARQEESTTDRKPESGAAAAVARLKTTKAQPKSEAHSGYKPRDFEKEAIGKTRCVQFEAALQSPAIAGMRFDTMEQYLALVKQAAEAGVAYTFGA